MATLTITHLGAVGDPPIRINELYAETKVGSPLVTENNFPASAIPGLTSLMEELAKVPPTVSLSVVYTADEIASGLHNPPQVVEAADIAPVVAADLQSGGILLRVPMVAGGGGAPDDIVLVPAGTLSARLRVLDIWAEITGNVAAATVGLRDQAAGAGNLLADVSGNAIALRVGPNTVYGGVTDAPAATIGLFARRSDNAVAGTLYAHLRPES